MSARSALTLLATVFTVIASFSGVANAGCNQGLKAETDRLAFALKDAWLRQDPNRCAPGGLLQKEIEAYNRFADSCSPLPERTKWKTQNATSIEGAFCGPLTPPYGPSRETARPATAKELAAPPISVPSKQTSVAATSLTSQRSSCSDITGTDSTTPATTNCKDGNTSLHAARVTRKKYGAYAQEQYKKAAASFRLAGDIGGAEAAEREAKLTDDVFDAQQKAAERATDAKKQKSEGEENERFAEKIEEGAFEDGSCADLEVAASYYRNAARAFLNAGVYDKASLDVQRDVRLGKIIKKAQAEGLCDRKLSTADRRSLLPPNGGDELADDPNGCAGMRARLTPYAENKAWIDTQMTNSNCHLNGTPMSLQERLKAALERANP